jgi:2,4-dienoyl-CoA reductase-like NADH-dependent reductase (Old Yellow Enzyme family)/thioredoxin reductase
MTFAKLFEPGRIGTMELKNRLIMPPMEPNFGSATGEVTDRMVNYYAARAKGGVGLIVTHIACVDYPVGKAVSNQISIDNDKFIPGMARLAEAIHNWGVKAVVQIHHAGRQTKPVWTDGNQPVAPSVEPCLFLQEAPSDVQPRALTYDEVQEKVQKFVDAAVRVQQAGFDGVMLHGAHGYLIGQFMSPLANKRQDRYGGDFNRRMRFPLEIIAGIREKLGPNFPILFRYNADDMYPGGITLDGPEGSGTSKEIAKKLEAAGVDALCISCGIYISMTTLLEPMMYDEGWRVYMAEAIKKDVKIPVSTVGVIRSPEVAEKILAEGKADFVEIGRTLIADPEWPNKAMAGKVDEIRKCISCNNCIGGRVFQMMTMTCTQNPEVGREGEWAELKPATTKKKVMVVGGGPAGMEAARVAHLRGHDVALYEKAELGGQLKIAVVPPGKAKINWVTDWLIGQIKKLGVKVQTGVAVDKTKIKAEEPDVVIIATGGEPLIPDIPGITGPNVVVYKDLLGGAKSVPGPNVVVAGGGMVGCECAWHLAEQGKKVTILEMLDDILLDMEPVTRAELMFIRLPGKGVTWRTKLMILEITPKGVRVIDRFGNKSVIPADNVVVALGVSSVNKLEAAAKAAGVPEVFVIGDAKKVRRTVDAKYEGAWVARQI